MDRPVVPWLQASTCSIAARSRFLHVGTLPRRLKDLHRPTPSRGKQSCRPERFFASPLCQSVRPRLRRHHSRGISIRGLRAKIHPPGRSRADEEREPDFTRRDLRVRDPHSRAKSDLPLVPRSLSAASRQRGAHPALVFELDRNPGPQGGGRTSAKWKHCPTRRDRQGSAVRGDRRRMRGSANRSLSRRQGRFH